MDIGSIQKKAVEASSLRLKLLSIKPTGKELKFWQASIQYKSPNGSPPEQAGGGAAGAPGGGGLAGGLGLAQMMAAAGAGGGGGMDQIKAELVQQIKKEMASDAKNQLEKSVTKIEGRLLAGFQMLQKNLNGRLVCMWCFCMLLYALVTCVCVCILTCRLGQLDTHMKALDGRVAALEARGQIAEVSEVTRPAVLPAAGDKEALEMLARGGGGMDISAEEAGKEMEVGDGAVPGTGAESGAEAGAAPGAAPPPSPPAESDVEALVAIDDEAALVAIDDEAADARADADA
jgi:hypothetical protein